VPVQRYQQTAEKYGYIVAGSLNSRNGPWEVSMKALASELVVPRGQRIPECVCYNRPDGFFLRDPPKGGE
jgi:hypothetical protein